MTIGIINLNCGNLGSLINSVKKFTEEIIVSGNPEELTEASKLILPGVGSFPSGMDALEKNGLDSFIREQVQNDKKLLGICLGMQLLLEIGNEGERREGLGLIKGIVDLLPKELGRLPHIGWNDLYSRERSILMKGVPQGSNVYFVHSYKCNLKEKAVLIHTDFYGQPIIAGYEKENIFGVQFHPEKSQEIGMQIFNNFFSQ